MVRRTIVLVLGILSMETLAVPLNLEISIKGSHNANTTDQDWTSRVGSGPEVGCVFAKINDPCYPGIDCGFGGCKDCCDKGLKCVPKKGDWRGICVPGRKIFITLYT